VGKFAAVYPLPGGEQLLAMVAYNAPGKEPEIWYVTEIMGEQVTITVPVRMEDGKPFSSPREAVVSAAAAITSMTDADVLAVRKYMVKRVTGQEATTDKEA